DTSPRDANGVDGIARACGVVESVASGLGKGATEPLGRVVAHGDDDAGRRIDPEEGPVRLDASRRADRLARALLESTQLVDVDGEFGGVHVGSVCRVGLSDRVR